MNYFAALYLFLTFLGINCCAQSLNDKTLYLLFQEQPGINKIDISSYPKERQLAYPDKASKVKPTYYFHNLRLYHGYPLDFKSLTVLPIDTISKDESKELPIVNHEQLMHFVASNFKGSNEEYPRYFASSYFNQLEHIFIVEYVDKSNYMILYEVKLNVQIE